MDRRREMTYHGSYVTEICIVVGGQVRLLGKLWRSAFIPEGYSQEPGFDLNLEFKHLTEEEIQDCPEFTHEYARICSFSIPPRPIRCLWMSGERKRFPLHLKFKVVRKYGRRIFLKKKSSNSSAEQSDLPPGYAVQLVFAHTQTHWHPLGISRK